MSITTRSLESATDMQLARVCAHYLLGEACAAVREVQLRRKAQLPCQQGRHKERGCLGRRNKTLDRVAAALRQQAGSAEQHWKQVAQAGTR